MEAGLGVSGYGATLVRPATAPVSIFDELEGWLKVGCFRAIAVPSR